MNVWRIIFLGCAVSAFAPAASDASVMSAAAAALQPGKSVAISTGLTGLDLQPDNSAGSILDWADSGIWDPVRRQFRFIGKEAGGTSHFRNIVYDETSNSWSYGPVPVAVGFGHGYDHNTGDPVTGTHYYRGYDSQTIYKFNGTSWTTMPALPSPVVIVAGIAKSPRGLLYSDPRWDVYYDDATGTRTVVDVNVAYPTWPKIGDYHSIAEYDKVHDVFLVGGGNNSLAMFRVAIVNGSPVRTRMNNAPWEYGVGEYDQHTTIVSDPVTGEFIIYKKQTGIFYGYNIMTDTWRQIGRSGDGNMPPLPTGTGTSSVAAAISTYNVIMWLGHTGSTAQVYLYKHAAAGPADTVNPSAPGQLLAR
ncbi:MAG TPA: hypothetical protein VI198_01090 [Candidatus Eisenbacteria bacterium]